MKYTLKLEELGQLLLVLSILYLLDAAWWTYALLALGPDVGMLGYLISPRVGAITYNITHHKGLACLLALWGLYQSTVVFTFDHPGLWALQAAAIIYGHASLDRILGYGLKFGDHFQHTHLGWIGKREREVGAGE